MDILVACHLVYQATDLTPTWLYILPTPSPRQHLSQESLQLSSPVTYREGYDPLGNRYLYICLPPGQLEISYQAVVEIQTMPPSPVAIPTGYLYPSRYCCPLQVHTLAQELFGGEPVDLALAHRLSQWVSQHLTYAPESSTWETTAMDTLLQKQGVCRDFAHSTIALARALEIPARYCSVYAPQLTPPDFHACCELFIAGEWVRLDPTGLALVENTVLIAHGRDAADAPVATFGGWATCLEYQVSAQVLTSAIYAQTA